MVLGTANHFVLDAVGGAAIVLLGLLVTHRRLPPHLPANPKTLRGELVHVARGDEVPPDEPAGGRPWPEAPGGPGRQPANSAG